MVEGRIERRLAAILAADVAGYSRLMGEDEEGTLATLKSYRSVIDELIQTHDGRVFGGAGSVRQSTRGFRRSCLHLCPG